MEDRQGAKDSLGKCLHLLEAGLKLIKDAAHPTCAFVSI